MRRADLTGRRFARLTVVRHVAPRNFKTQVECRCDCGNVVVVDAYNVQVGHSKSCGCLHVETGRSAGLRSRVHGHSLVNGKSSRTYKSWSSMIARCHNENHVYFARYGGRGISVTKPWRESFEAFLNDMGERPSGMSLDRIDNRFGYVLSNCRWATAKQQQQNRIPKTTLKDFPKAMALLACR